MLLESQTMWIGALVIVALFGLRRFIQGRQFQSDLRIDGKVVVITGCNTGIGKETVLDLAGRGGRIYMACRDTQKCEETRLDIIRQTGNKNVFNRKLDLASLDSVRDFVKIFLSEETHLDILINNAGIMMVPKSMTKDNFESHIGVNHLGHFLLTRLLLDVIKTSAPSRIVNVSSDAHLIGRINKTDLMSEHSYNRITAYAQSKLANILFTRELAKQLQGTGVTTNSLHPGVVNTELIRYVPGHRALSFLWQFFTKTPKSGAQTTLTVALDPALSQVSGKYFANCRVKRETRAAQNDEIAEWLWQISEQLTGLNKNDDTGLNGSSKC